MMVFASLLALIFLVLSGLHFYWALFGIQIPENVYPSREYGNQMEYSPGRFASSAVGSVLLSFRFLFLNRVLQWVNFPFEFYLVLGIGILFLLRGVGDFKYLGLFKGDSE